MLGFLFSTKKEQVVVLNNCKILDTECNNQRCSKITLKAGTTAQYEAIKNHTHRGVLPIYKLSKHSVYTKKIVPLCLCIEKNKELYCRYVIIRMKEALEFIHTEIQREGIPFDLETVFIDEAGEPMLGCFERTLKLVDKETDYEKLNRLSIEITGQTLDEIFLLENKPDEENTNKCSEQINEKDVKNKKRQVNEYSDEDFESQCLELSDESKWTGDESEVSNTEHYQRKKSNLCTIEDINTFTLMTSVNTTDISLMKDEEKRSLLVKLVDFRKEIPQIAVKNIFAVFMQELDKDNCNNYKVFVLECLLKLDRVYFFDLKRVLFSVLNSSVRMFLLRVFQQSESVSCGLDEIVNDLSIGLRVKEKSMKAATIEFVFSNTFNTQSMSHLLQSMTSCTDTASITAICTHLLKMERVDVYESLYAVLHGFLMTGKAPALVCKCIDRFYVHFDKVKLTEDVLPQLCSRLSYGEDQEAFFSLLEKIIKFLKEHKEEIQNSRLSLRSISSIFTKREEPKDRLEEVVARMAKNEQT